MMGLFCRHKRKRIAYESKLRRSFDKIYYCPDCKRYATYIKDLDKWGFWGKDPFKNKDMHEWDYVDVCGDCIFRLYCGERSRTVPCKSKITKEDVKKRLHERK